MGCTIRRINVVIVQMFLITELNCTLDPPSFLATSAQVGFILPTSQKMCRNANNIRVTLCLYHNFPTTNWVRIKLDRINPAVAAGLRNLYLAIINIKLSFEYFSNEVFKMRPIN